MKYFDLIITECKRLNEAIEKHFNHWDIYFVSAGHDNISYGFNKDLLVFRYSTERYHLGKTMLLTGVAVKLGHDSQKTYPISQVIAFIESGCTGFEDTYDFPSLESAIASITQFYELIQLEGNIGWEQKYVEYINAKFSNW